LLDRTAILLPPAPVPRANPLGMFGLLRVLVNNPLEAWTEAHFNEPVVVGGLPLVRVAVVSDPAAIRRVLLDNSANYKKDWIQRRILSAGLSNGLLTAESGQWRSQRRMLAPLFAAKAVGRFSAAMRDAAHVLVERLHRQRGQVVDLAVEFTRVGLDVLERTIFSDGLGSDPEEIRKGMKRYFEAIGQIDPIDLLGLPAAMPRLGRLRARPALRVFEQAIDAIIATRRRNMAQMPARARGMARAGARGSRPRARRRG
jgi:cytochrome P450